MRLAVMEGVGWKSSPNANSLLSLSLPLSLPPLAHLNWGVSRSGSGQGNRIPHRSLELIQPLSGLCIVASLCFPKLIKLYFISYLLFVVPKFNWPESWRAPQTPKHTNWRSVLSKGMIWDWTLAKNVNSKSGKMKIFQKAVEHAGMSVEYRM